MFNFIQKRRTSIYRRKELNFGNLELRTQYVQVKSNPAKWEALDKQQRMGVIYEAYKLSLEQQPSHTPRAVDKTELEKVSDQEQIQWFYIKHPACLEHADPDLWKDSEFVKNVISSYPICLAWAPKQIAENEAYQQLALTSKAELLKDLSGLKSDDDQVDLHTKERLGIDFDDNQQVKKALEIRGSLAKDAAVLLEAIKVKEGSLNLQTPATLLGFASNDLLNDATFMEKAISRNPSCYRFIGGALKENAYLAKIALKNLGVLYAELPDPLKHNKELALVAATSDSTIDYSWFPENFRDDKKFALVCVKTHPRALLSMTGRIQEDREIVLEAVKVSATQSLNRLTTSDLLEKHHTDTEIMEYVDEHVSKLFR